jgi:hypothetical protein
MTETREEPASRGIASNATTWTARVIAVTGKHPYRNMPRRPAAISGLT